MTDLVYNYDMTAIRTYLEDEGFDKEIVVTIINNLIINDDEKNFYYLELGQINIVRSLWTNVKKAQGLVHKMEKVLRFDSFSGVITMENKTEYAKIKNEIVLKGSIVENKKVIKNTIKDNRIILIRGGTGIGKTTILPYLLLDDYKKVCCTQPRRLAAISVAERVVKLNKCKAGVDVGYAVRFETNRTTNTKLVFMTEGILIKEILKTPKQFDGKYDLIFIDEAHERNLNTDILLGYLKHFVSKTKIVIMSATFEGDKFSDYFNCPVLTFENRSFEVKEIYLPVPEEFSVELCVRRAFKILSKNKNANILVFMDGKKNIQDACQMANQFLSSSDVTVLPLYSELPKEQQNLVFENSRAKIVFSTNVAETSITIPGITDVIDSGLFKEQEISSYKTSDSEQRECRANSLFTRYISKSQAKQRAGRAGRTSNGNVHRMYTKEQFELFNENNTPEILLTEISQTILFIIAMEVKIDDFDFMDKPTKEKIDEALNELKMAKVIDENYFINNLGKELVTYPVDFKMGLSLLKARELGCFNKVAIIFASHICSPILHPIPVTSSEYVNFKRTQSTFKKDKGIHYYFVDVYERWRATKFSSKWAEKRYFKPEVLYKLKQIKEQLNKSFNYFQRDECEGVEKAMIAGYFMNISIRKQEKYMTLRNGNLCDISFHEGLITKRPKYILFFEMIATMKKECVMINCLGVMEEDIRGYLK